MKPWYLATPYTNYPDGHEAAFRAAALLTARLHELGVRVFCPITHSHPISVALPSERSSFAYWLDIDLWAVDNSKGVLVGQLPTWRASQGVQKEVQRARFADLPVLYLHPATLCMQLVPFPEDAECPGA
ncbi:MAG: DUF1937 family protein [Patescibacteria group bacterium]|nr:DUF1937 family protein [Patescibacteria group bacterium]